MVRLQSMMLKRPPQKKTLYWKKPQSKEVSKRLSEFIHPDGAAHFTIAVVYLNNGYIVTGESAPADPENFDEKLGQEIAYENAVRKIWPMEGYLLREVITW